MATRMLVDARHTEETRVAVLKGKRIEEFDFESDEHKQIKGNVYLAKVTRVEPSLQAAFVDFGGNRHGFLAFSEIHPDYYQIPKDDRDALLAEEAEAAEEEARLRADQEDEGLLPGDEYDADDDNSGEALAEDLAEDGLEEIDTSEKDRVATIEEGEVENDDDDLDDAQNDPSDHDDTDEEQSRNQSGRRRRRRRPNANRERAKEVDAIRARRQALRRRYKIQDVIQRRQVLLVQVVKEERGNKGAALSTYLSLAGRYTVLMPNSSHGGGISRKISNAQDRKRLKQVMSDLNLPKSMGLIVRTAGVRRTKTEIKRDFDYLARVWDKIREKTLGSSAPNLIHSDSDLIKRAIRDIYSREIEEVIVEGEEGYKLAKQFMKLLMPSHARRVKPYADPVPLFQRYGAEDQLRAMYDPVVQLKSGGYLVINPTEALVSIDINSGRSTKEHSIEKTALATNLEAAQEIARQLRLRDMAGLVVIDFIDMEYNSNIRKVERVMKDSLKTDRARIQVGRISSFGLMEMSRQRLRTGVLEATTRDCPHCDGSGLVRTASSAGLSALRQIEDEASKGKGSIITVGASTEAAIYLLNSKRQDLSDIEQRYNVSINVIPEGEDEGAKMTVTSSGPRPERVQKFEPIIDDDEDVLDEEPAIEEDEAHDEKPAKKRRRRRGGRGNKDKQQRDADDIEQNDDDARHDDADKADDDGPEKKRRRGRRGGRGRNRQTSNDTDSADAQEAAVSEKEEPKPPVSTDGDDEKSAKKPRTRRKAASPSDSEETTEAKTPAKRTRTRRKTVKDDVQTDSVSDASANDPEANPEEKPKPKRRQRAKSPSADQDAPAADQTAAEPEAKPPRKRTRARAADKSKTVQKDMAEPAAPASEPSASQAAVTEPAIPSSSDNQDTAPEKPAKRKRGWWQRTFGD